SKQGGIAAGVVSFMGHFLTLYACYVRIITYFYRILCLSPAKRDCCREKLSQTLIDSSVQDEVDRDKARFSKGTHTPLLLREIDPNEVKKKCPLFRELYNYLNNFCPSS
ncbi:hypothetical protein QUA13_32000, partial [Microcoleus sp. S28C3]